MIYTHVLYKSLQLNTLAIFEPTGLTMRVNLKRLMSASLLRPRVKQTLRQALATVKCGYTLRKELRNNEQQFLASISPSAR